MDENMLYRKDNEFALMPLVARFTQYGEPHEKYVEDEAEMRGFEDMGHITDLSFEDATYPEDYVKRLEEVKHEPGYDLVETYVLTGELITIEPMPEQSSSHILTLESRVDALESAMLDIILGGA